jgi:hypothetical protein
MLRTGGWGPHEVSGKASNTGSESHLASPSNPSQHTFRLDSEMASKLGELGQARKDVQELLALEPDLTVSDFLARTPFPLMRMAETYATALKAAGLPC